MYSARASTMEKPWCWDKDGSSTTAPSPALTFASSLTSPVTSPSLQAETSTAPPSMQLWASKVEPEPLTLPASLMSEAQEFELSGFRDALVHLLAMRLRTPVSPKIMAPTTLDIAPPPGLAQGRLPPPPGLGVAPKRRAAPVFEAQDPTIVDPNPSITVAELHKLRHAPPMEEATVETEQTEKKEMPHLSPGCTTVMLRNIPNKYTREMLYAQLQAAGYTTEVDFLYLPIDFRNRCNVGYAFLSFRTEASCSRFAAEYHLQDSSVKLPGFRSKKVCEVSEARCQGRHENVRRLQSSPVMQQLTERPEWLPLLFSEDGEVEEFPLPQTVAAPPPPPVQKQVPRPTTGRLSRRPRAP